MKQCAASTGYKEKYVGQMVHTKFHGLQTDNHLNWKNRINQISNCACKARVHLLMCLILMYVYMYVCMYCVCVCVRMYVRVCVCVCMYEYMCVCVCMYL